MMPEYYKYGFSILPKDEEALAKLAKDNDSKIEGRWLYIPPEKHKAMLDAIKGYGYDMEYDPELMKVVGGQADPEVLKIVRGEE